MLFAPCPEGPQLERVRRPGRARVDLEIRRLESEALGLDPYSDRNRRFLTRCIQLQLHIFDLTDANAPKLNRRTRQQPAYRARKRQTPLLAAFIFPFERRLPGRVEEKFGALTGRQGFVGRAHVRRP